jgi:hypothetical protein
VLTTKTEQSQASASPVDTPIPAETLAAITAAAAVFVGKRLRIRSIEQVGSTRLPASRWSRQGRVLVQSSHNLALRHMTKAK